MVLLRDRCRRDTAVEAGTRVDRTRRIFCLVDGSECDAAASVLDSSFLIANLSRAFDGLLMTSVLPLSYRLLPALRQEKVILHACQEQPQADADIKNREIRFWDG